MTQTHGVWQRVLTRAAIGLRHQTQTLVIGGVALVAITGYLLFVAPALSGGSTASGQGGADCADTVMAAVLGVGAAPSVQQQAYQCMDSTFQQRVSPQEFASQFRTPGGDSPVTKVSRLGTYDGQSGTDLVYYAVDSGQQSVAFVVYLNPDGKVTQID